MKAASVSRLLGSPRALYVAFAVALIVLGIHFGRFVRAPITEVDEAAVIYSTGYLGLVLDGDFTSQRWGAIDAIDHPPAWKYVHGLVLKLAGRELGSLELKDLWLDWAWNDADEKAFDAHLAVTVPTADLIPGRTLSFVAILAALALAGGLFARAASPRAACLVVALLAFQLPIKWVSVRALIDGLLLFAILGTTWLTARWLERGPAKERVGWPTALGLGVAIGVMTQTKITGVVGLAGAGLAALVYAFADGATTARRKSLAMGLAIVAGSAGVTAFALNPALWSDPVSVAVAMGKHRARQLELQMMFSQMRGHISVTEGLRRFVHRLICWNDPAWRAAYVPLVGWLVAFGASSFLRGLRVASPAKLAVLAQLSLWAFATSLTFRLDWMRYLLPALPLVTLLAAIAIVELLEAPRSALSGRGAGSLVLAVALALWAHRGFVESDAERAQRWATSVRLIDDELAGAKAGPHKRAALERRRQTLVSELPAPSPAP